MLAAANRKQWLRILGEVRVAVSAPTNWTDMRARSRIELWFIRMLGEI
jgi:hypothetical protein